MMDELQVPPCSEEELQLLLLKWLGVARETRDPKAVAMARAFAAENARRRTMPPSTLGD